MGEGRYHETQRQRGGVTLKRCRELVGRQWAGISESGGAEGVRASGLGDGHQVRSVLEVERLQTGKTVEVNRAAIGSEARKTSQVQSFISAASNVQV